MKKEFGEYQRLARGFFGCSSLWQGEDHLLYVRGRGFLIPFSEEYLRFRYRDIQSLVIVATSGRAITGILYALGTVLAGGLCGLILNLREAGEVWPLVMVLLFPFPVAMAFLLLFVRTLVLGRRCVFEIQTSLKKERFRMLTRVPNALRVLSSLEDRINKAQGDLAGEGVDISRDTVETPEPDRAGGPKLTIPKSVLPAFAVSVLMGTLMLLLLHLNSVMIAWLTHLLGLAFAPLVLFAIAASVRQLTTDGIRFLLWGLLASLLMTGGGGMIYLLIAAMENPAVTVSPLSYIDVFASVSSNSNFGFYLYFLVAGAAMLLLGVLGLLQAMLWKNTNNES